MVFNLVNGSTVRAARLSNGLTEFVTLNSDGDVISTVRKARSEAVATLAALHRARQSSPVRCTA